MDKLALLTFILEAGSKLLSWIRSPLPMKRLLAGEMQRNRRRIKLFLYSMERNGSVSFNDVAICIENLEYLDTQSVLHGMNSLSKLAYRKTPVNSEFPYRLRDKFLDDVFQKFVNNAILLKEDFAIAQDCDEDIKRFTKRIRGRYEELAAAIFIMTK
jgi:hypothetical protein